MTANLSETASAQASLSAISSASTLAPAATFTVAANDVIFITVSELGREILTLTLRGSSSVCQLMEQLRRHLEGIEGLLTLNFRNGTQGTSVKRVLRLRRSGATILRSQMKGKAA